MVCRLKEESSLACGSLGLGRLMGQSGRAQFRDETAKPTGLFAFLHSWFFFSLLVALFLAVFLFIFSLLYIIAYCRCR